MAFKFLQARSYAKGRGGKKVSYIFIHTMETPETKGRAKQVWAWFAWKTSPKASAHFMVDNTSIFQNVKLTDTAYAVGNSDLNARSISIELAGQAKQTKAEWNDTYSTAMLKRAATLTAQLCKEKNIPVRKASPNDITKGIPGIAGHLDVTIAKAIYGGHTDPGKNFPWVKFLALVKLELAKLG